MKAITSKKRSNKLMNLFSNKAIFIPLILSALLLLSCEDNRFRIDFSEVPDPFSITGIEPDTLNSGLIIYVIREGTGIYEVTNRDQIRFHYTVRNQNDNLRIISSSFANGNKTPSTSTVSSPVVSALGLQGFKQGVLGMKEGEKRVLIVPPDLAYGGNPRSQYSDDTLWIDVELVEIIF